jgi:hypothetical protein
MAWYEKQNEICSKREDFLNKMENPFTTCAISKKGACR